MDWISASALVALNMDPGEIPASHKRPKCMSWTELSTAHAHESTWQHTAASSRGAPNAVPFTGHRYASVRKKNVRGNLRKRRPELGEHAPLDLPK